MELDELKIYKQYVEMIYYTEMILKKYPKSERFSLVTSIKNKTYEGLECIIRVYKVFEKKEKYKYLNELDVYLKTLKVLIRVSYKNKYISSKNYSAWIKKITNINNLMLGWFKCVKV